MLLDIFCTEQTRWIVPSRRMHCLPISKKKEKDQQMFVASKTWVCPSVFLVERPPPSKKKNEWSFVERQIPTVCRRKHRGKRGTAKTESKCTVTWRTNRCDRCWHWEQNTFGRCVASTWLSCNSGGGEVMMLTLGRRGGIVVRSSSRITRWHRSWQK